MNWPIDDDVDRENGVCGMRRDPSELPNRVMLKDEALRRTRDEALGRSKDEALGRLKDESVIRALRSLPRRMPPPGLTGSLRVIASREQRRRVYGSHGEFADRL